jgi:hypothetical protein
LYAEAGFYARIDSLKIADRMRQVGSGAAPVVRAKSTLAFLAMRRGRFGEAETIFREVLSASETAGQLQDAAIAGCNLGLIVGWTGRFEAGIGLMEPCIAWLETNSPHIHSLRAVAHLCVLYGYARRRPEAEAAALRACNGAVALLGRDSLTTAAIFLTCARGLDAAGNKRDAKRYRREANEIRGRLHADMHIDVSDLLPRPKPQR